MTGHEFWNGFSEKKGKENGRKDSCERDLRYGRRGTGYGSVRRGQRIGGLGQRDRNIPDRTVGASGEKWRGRRRAGRGLSRDRRPYQATVENGGKIWVCPACAGANGITADDLIEGASLVGAVGTIGFLADGARTIM